MPSRFSDTLFEAFGGVWVSFDLYHYCFPFVLYFIIPLLLLWQGRHMTGHLFRVAIERAICGLFSAVVALAGRAIQDALPLLLLAATLHLPRLGPPAPRWRGAVPRVGLRLAGSFLRKLTGRLPRR